jgi:hypothetical protein
LEILESMGKPYTALEPSPCLRSEDGNPALAHDVESIHTPTMTLKNAALLALIGTILATALLVWDLIFNVLNVLRGLVPAVILFPSLIYAFGALTVMVFFFVFHKAQT